MKSYYIYKLRNHLQHTRVRAAWIFADMARGKLMASEVPKFFYIFCPQLNTFLEFCLTIFVVSCSNLSEVLKTVSYSGMSRFISVTKLCPAASFTRTPHYSTLNVTYNNSLSITQPKTSSIYSDIAVFSNFKVSLLLPDPCGDFAMRPKSKTKRLMKSRTLSSRRL